MKPTDSQIPRHPMRFVSRRTGLSADVLRAWEKRYQAVGPNRSSGGQRLYSDEDLDRLTLLNQVTSNGRNISQVARLGAEQLRSLLIEDSGAARAHQSGNDEGTDGLRELVGRLLDAAESLDPIELERLLRRGVLNFGAATLIEEAIVPFLHEVGQRWHRNELTPAHEHVASTVVQRTLHWILEGTNPLPNAPRMVIASLSGERHELGLQIVAAVASGEEWRVIFLGSDLPTEVIGRATVQAGARVLALSIVAAGSNTSAVQQIAMLRKKLGNTVTILVGGAAAHRFQDELAALDVHVLTDLDQLRSFLQTYRPPVDQPIEPNR